MSTNFQPDKEMQIQAQNCFQYADSYLKTFQNSLNNQNSRFNNDMLYNLAVMCTEKFYVALMARYDWNATHHMPISMYKEALTLDPELPTDFKDTAILVGKFEAICSLDGFGYHTPSNQELNSMSSGLQKLKSWVEKRMNEI